MTERANRRTKLMMAVATLFDRGQMVFPREWLKEHEVSKEEKETIQNSVAFALFGYLMAPKEIQREIVRAYTRRRW